jgi:hypothetical protein
MAATLLHESDCGLERIAYFAANWPEFNPSGRIFRRNDRLQSEAIS